MERVRNRLWVIFSFWAKKSEKGFFSLSPLFRTAKEQSQYLFSSSSSHGSCFLPFPSPICRWHNLICSESPPTTTTEKPAVNKGRWMNVAAYA